MLEKLTSLFRGCDVITSRQIGELLGFKPRTNSAMCKQWCEAGLLMVVNPAQKSRTYRLADEFAELVGVVV